MPKNQDKESQIKKDNKKVAKTQEKAKKSKYPDDLFHWYIVNTYAGHELKAQAQLKARIKANLMEEEIPEVLVPMQEKIVLSKGKKKNVKEKIFPGYILIRMIMNEKTWTVVRNTEGVTGFVGQKKKPTPLNPDEVKSILAFSQVKQPIYQSSFSVKDAVKIIDKTHPFTDFVGTISEINQDKGQVKVLISVFGRETPVILDFLQIKKL